MTTQQTCSPATARKLARSFELENQRYGFHNHGTAQLTIDENDLLGAGSYRRTPRDVLIEDRVTVA